MLLLISKEIKLLMNELDEEKRIRLTLQVRHNKTREIQLVRQLEYYRCNQADLQLIFVYSNILLLPLDGDSAYEEAHVEMKQRTLLLLLSS